MDTVLDKYIEQSPDTRGGRPRIAGTRITIDDLVIMHLHLGESLDEIAGTYNLPLAAVYAAMAYYFDNRDEIDKKIAQDDAYVEATSKKSPSKLHAKLKALRGE